MKARPVLRAVSGGVARRKVQTVVVFTVLMVSTASAALGLGLLVDSNGPFQHSFAAQRGADVAASVDATRATDGQLAATRRLPQVTAAAGPFDEVTITPRINAQGGITLPPVTVVGRVSPGGGVDDLTLDAGRWVQRPGEIVVSRDSPDVGGPTAQLIGTLITVTSAPGRPTLTVVGVAKSITDTADGWVTPAQAAALRAPHTPPAAQMLYRFHSAATQSQVTADVTALTRALPAGAVAGTTSWLTVKSQETRTISIIVPFVVAFGVIGLAMSVVIVTNVVNGAVVSGYRRIGVLKSIGFTPAQVVAAYVAQVGFPALAGALVGVVLGNVLSVPLLSQTATVYGVGRLLVPASVDIGVPLLMCALVGLAALLPALRAGRLSAVAAIATGRAPRAGRGYAAHRLLAWLPLPRPVTIGLADPFARLGRTAVTVAAVMFGATSVVFAVGLDSSLNKASNGQSHAASEQVQVAAVMHVGTGPQGKTGKVSQPTPGPSQGQPVVAALQALHGTLHFTAEDFPMVSLSGLTAQVPTEAFRGDAAWTGYDMISGRWYRAPGEVVVNTAFLTQTGKSVGDRVTITFGGRQTTARIVGEAFDPQGRGQPAMITSWQTLGGTGSGLTVQQYDVGLRPGTDPVAYSEALNHALFPGWFASANSADPFYATLTALIGTLTLLIAIAAGLGVLNTVVLGTRDRVYDLGVFKAVGMTPRQTMAMVVCWVVGAGLAAGVIAVPVSTILHAHVARAMASAGGTALPASYINVFTAAELVLLALAGLVIAVAGALLPAGWAARAATVSALRAE
ncbi:MAG TPA: ABC transporter permease [Streptosporangiaceae bacterium]|nr:ABC transporter permease [Streptosporangiaceae bacterium]